MKITLREYMYECFKKPYWFFGEEIKSLKENKF